MTTGWASPTIRSTMAARVFVFGSINTDLVVYIHRLPQPGETLGGGNYRSFPAARGQPAVAAAKAGAEVPPRLPRRRRLRPGAHRGSPADGSFHRGRADAPRHPVRHRADHRGRRGETPSWSPRAPTTASSAAGSLSSLPAGEPTACPCCRTRYHRRPRRRSSATAAARPPRVLEPSRPPSPGTRPRATCSPRWTA